MLSISGNFTSGFSKADGTNPQTTQGKATHTTNSKAGSSSGQPANASKVLVLNHDGEPRCYYGLHAAVGPSGSNARTDVLVVQYFLKVALAEHPAFTKTPFPKAIAVDGVAGPITFAAIQHFQRTLKQRGCNISTDGRVDPAVSGAKGSISGTQYTILFLNVAFKECRPGDWPKVSQAWDCPEELRALFREPPTPPFVD